MSAKPLLLACETLDDRREIHRMLHRLPPVERVRFLDRVAKRIRVPNSEGLGASWFRMNATIKEAYRCDRADLRLTNEVYADCVGLAVQWDVDLLAVAVELEQLVRRLR
jgi:hypothetical protein